jgi:hypothetical protein
MQEELLLSVFKKRFSIRIFFIKDFLLLINFSRRITPAYAGKTGLFICSGHAPYFSKIKYMLLTVLFVTYFLIYLTGILRR